MEKKTLLEKNETRLLNIMLPQELMERVQTYCTEREITIQEYVTDAIIEKLELVYKERRKKPRL